MYIKMGIIINIKIYNYQLLNHFRVNTYINIINILKNEIKNKN